jgi:hypothetical protein
MDIAINGTWKNTPSGEIKCRNQFSGLCDPMCFVTDRDNMSILNDEGYVVLQRTSCAIDKGYIFKRRVDTMVSYLLLETKK